VSINGIALFAHRGGMITSPENTLEAVSRAKSEDVDGMELDVRLTRDREPVLFHDHGTERVTGRGGWVREMSWKELSSLRVFGRHRIPHLDEVLDALLDWPGASLSFDFHEESLRLAEITARRLESYEARHRVTVLDFYSRRGTLFRAREVFPEIRLAVMPGAPWNTDVSIRELRPVEIFLGWDGPLNKRLYRTGCALYDVRSAIRRARGAGVSVSGGVANTPEDVRYCLSHGVGGIWSDDLVMARKALENSAGRAGS